jgi:hypothetical protein
MEFFKNRSIKRFHRRLLRVSIGINAVLLLFMMLRPANEMVANYKYLYDNIDLRKRTILTIEKDNYSLMAGLKSTFYKPDSCITYVLGSEESLRSYLQENQIDTCFFVYGKYEFKGIVEGYTTEKVYSVYPDWLKTIHWVDWQKTLKTHSIYLVALKKNSDNFHQ